MRLEISIPDGITWLEFKNVTPPDGVTVRVSPISQQYSVDVSSALSVFIDFSTKVASNVLAGLILVAFAKFRSKRPDYKVKINHREVRLEHTEILRIIEEVRSEDHSDETNKGSP